MQTLRVYVTKTAVNTSAFLVNGAAAKTVTKAVTIGNDTLCLVVGILAKLHRRFLSDGRLVTIVRAYARLRAVNAMVVIVTVHDVTSTMDATSSANAVAVMHVVRVAIRTKAVVMVISLETVQMARRLLVMTVALTSKTLS